MRYNADPIIVINGQICFRVLVWADLLVLPFLREGYFYLFSLNKRKNNYRIKITDIEGEVG